MINIKITNRLQKAWLNRDQKADLPLAAAAGIEVVAAGLGALARLLFAGWRVGRLRAGRAGGREAHGVVADGEGVVLAELVEGRGDLLELY